MTAQRFPLAPLRRAHPISVGLLAEHIGVSRRTVCRYARHGMTEDQADRAACALGTHPAIVWHEWLR